MKLDGIGKSENPRGKYKLLGRKEKNARLIESTSRHVYIAREEVSLKGRKLQGRIWVKNVILRPSFLPEKPILCGKFHRRMEL